ncbi:MAG: HepT-like ribonuclease domain-containing protein, partial [Variovorax sp.]
PFATPSFRPASTTLAKSCMQRDVRAWLWDAREAADAISAFVSGMDRATYAGSELVHSAVERKFEIIGEALNQLSKRDALLAARIPDLAQIVAFRNLLIHGYALVQHDRVWDVVARSLPQLRKAVDELLTELGPLQP